MDSTVSYNALFYIGVTLMSVSVLGGAVTLFIRRQAGRRLREKLEEEYGKKRL